MDCIGLQALSDTSESEKDDLSISDHSNINITDNIAENSNQLFARIELNDNPLKRVTKYCLLES